MPIYEYICQQCQKVTEVILMASDPRPTRCPECGGKLHKRISAPAIQFKGSGWYVTDYAKRPANADAPNAKPAEGTVPSPSADKPAEKKDAPAPAAKEPSKTAKEAPAAKKEN